MKSEMSPRGGAAGMLFLFCLAIGGAALAFDLTLHHGAAFWVAAKPGARALIGFGVAVIAAVAAHLARLLFARSPKKGASDASDHT